MHSYFSRLSAVFGFTFTVLACLLFATGVVDPLLKPDELPTADIELHTVRDMGSGKPIFSLQAGMFHAINMYMLIE